jgi:hypothetical protein
MEWSAKDWRVFYGEFAPTLPSFINLLFGHKHYLPILCVLKKAVRFPLGRLLGSNANGI